MFSSGAEGLSSVQCGSGRSRDALRNRWPVLMTTGVASVPSSGRRGVGERTIDRGGCGRRARARRHTAEGRSGVQRFLCAIVDTDCFLRSVSGAAPVAVANTQRFLCTVFSRLASCALLLALCPRQFANAQRFP